MVLPTNAHPYMGVTQVLTGPLDETSGAAHADRAAARAMLRATGWKEDDFRKPIIVVAVPHTNATPVCAGHGAPLPRHRCVLVMVLPCLGIPA